MSYNSKFKFSAIGHISYIEDMKYHQDKPFLHVTVAYTESYKPEGSDDYVETPVYLRVTFIGKNAERASKNVYVGRGVSFFGKIKPSKWEDDNGKTHYGHNFIVDDPHYFGESKSKHEKNKKSK